MRYRGAGRTTTLIIEAVNLAQIEPNKTVYLVGQSKQHARGLYESVKAYCKKEGIECWWQEANAIVFLNNSASIKAIPAGYTLLDWQSGMIRGESIHAHVLFDHYVLERKMGWMLEAWLKNFSETETRKKIQAQQKDHTAA